MTSTFAKYVLPMLLDAGGKGIGAVANSRANRRKLEADERTNTLDREQDLKIEQMGDATDRAELSLDESELDPFRDLIAQIEAAERLDRLANLQPLNIDFSNSRPGSFAPRVTGGEMNYAPSDELRGAATTARTTALSGQGTNAPVIDPQRVREALNLLAGSAPPRQPVSTAMPVRPQPHPRQAVPAGAPAPLNLADGSVDPLAMTYGQQPPMPMRRPMLRRRRQSTLAA